MVTRRGEGRWGKWRDVSQWYKVVVIELESLINLVYSRMTTVSNHVLNTGELLIERISGALTT